MLSHQDAVECFYGTKLEKAARAADADINELFHERLGETSEAESSGMDSEGAAVFADEDESGWFGL